MWVIAIVSKETVRSYSFVTPSIYSKLGKGGANLTVILGKAIKGVDPLFIHDYINNLESRLFYFNGE